MPINTNLFWRMIPSRLNGRRKEGMRGNCEGMHLVEHVVGHAGNFEEACYLCDHWHGLLTDGDYYVGVWVRFGDDGPKVYERHSWGDGHFDA